MTSTHVPDLELLYYHLDRKRRKRRIRWRQVAEECRVSPSSISRLSAGTGVSAEVFVSLVAWTEADARLFIRHRTQGAANGTTNGTANTNGAQSATR